MSNHYTKEHYTNLSYKGLPIYSTLWVHEEVLDYILMNFRLDSKILVFWSGSWAFELRLIDAGYKNIHSCDYSEWNFRLSVANFTKIDFNSNFSKAFKGSKFELVVLIDVVEHTYSIHNLVLQIAKILDIWGDIIMATPNIHSDESIANSMIFWWPISHEWIPYKFEHFSIPSYWIIKSISESLWFFEMKCTSILKTNFNVFESTQITVLRRLSCSITKFVFWLSNKFQKIDWTEISKFIPIWKQKELRKWLYLLTHFRKWYDKEN